MFYFGRCASPDRGLPAPDCVIFLELPIEKAVLRGEFGAERYEKADFQGKVAGNFKALQARDAAAGGPPWHVLDASKTIEELNSEILAIALSTSKTASNEPIRRLWVNSK